MEEPKTKVEMPERKKKAKSDIHAVEWSGENCVVWEMKAKRNASRNNGTAKVSRPNADGRSPIRIMDLDCRPSQKWSQNDPIRSEQKPKRNECCCLGERNLFIDNWVAGCWKLSLGHHHPRYLDVLFQDHLLLLPPKIPLFQQQPLPSPSSVHRK